MQREISDFPAIDRVELFDMLYESRKVSSLWSRARYAYDTKICPIFEIIRDRCKIPRLISFESTVGMDYSSFVSIGVLNM